MYNLMTHSFKLKADACFERVLTFWENLANAITEINGFGNPLGSSKISY